MSQRFPYVEGDPILGPASALPYAPITLQRGERKVHVYGLVDSGATLSVLPFEVGLQLGAVWDEQSVPVRLGGNMAEAEARGLVLIGQIEGFPPCRLAFAWSQNNHIPVILGQTNFFLEYEIRFCRFQRFFEVAARSSLGS